LQFIFKKISMIPDLVERLKANLPKEYQEILTRDHTVFKKIEAHAVIQEGTATFDVIDIVADVFRLHGQGTVDWQQNADLTFTIEVPKDLSRSMIQAVEELGFFADAEGKISIPLERYEGPIASFRPFPDLEKLGRQFIQTKGKEEIQKLLDKVLHREGTSSEQVPASPSPGQPSDGSQQSPEGQIIEGILDTIWKK
ncbi:MAG: hypothetical protein NUV91_02230, partial [Candidatus Omnitrophica bacterium]|nr:hypothetical protein [Candidatus Omnitrophota bacterium]